MTTRKSPNSLRTFENWGEHSLQELDQAKKMGRKIVGVFCTYAPLEIIRATGAIPISLCGKKQAPIADAERILPAAICPLIKSSFGYALTGTCPFYDAADFIIGETTCDGKKKMFEIMGKMKPLFILQLPYSQNDAAAFDLWKDQVMKMKCYLEEQTGNKITEEVLQREIAIYRQQRQLSRELINLCREHPVPLSGLEMLLVLESSSFVVDMEKYNQALIALVSELKEMKAVGIAACSTDTPRILLTGCPIGKGSDKVLRITEESGGVVVAMENCTGIKKFDQQVAVQGDPYENICRRYLNTPCSCMSPNQGRFELIKRLAAEFKIDAIVDLSWQGCHTYNIEASSIHELASKTLQIPYLHIDTDYSENDSEQIRTRIEALIEMI